MSKFLSFLGWFFGIIFLLGAIPYFWCGEFFLGLWSLVVVVVLIPPLYKYASGKLNSPFSKPKTLIFSLVVFVFLFANFIRPLFSDYMTRSEKEWLSKTLKREEKVKSYCDISIKINKTKPKDSQEIKCSKLIRIYKDCSLTVNQAQSNQLEYEKSKEIPNCWRLYVLISNRTFLPDLLKTFAKLHEDFRKNLKLKCGDF